MKRERSIVADALSLRGRRFLGVSGWEGKPAHPPLTDIPIGAYLVAVALDAVAFIWRDASWSTDVYRAATFAMTAGAVVSVATAITGLADWLGIERGTPDRRLATAHALVMVTMTSMVAAALYLRWFVFDAGPDAVILMLSVAIAIVLVTGAAMGGSLVYDHGFHVRQELPRSEAEIRQIAAASREESRRG